MLSQINIKDVFQALRSASYQNIKQVNLQKSKDGKDGVDSEEVNNQSNELQDTHSKEI